MAHAIGFPSFGHFEWGVGLFGVEKWLVFGPNCADLGTSGEGVYKKEVFKNGCQMVERHILVGTKRWEGCWVWAEPKGFPWSASSPSSIEETLNHGMCWVLTRNPLILRGG